MDGVLILVVGPSGVGKDTLLDGARQALASDGRYVFARRCITRPVSPTGEQHVAVSEQAFEEAEREDAYALSWRAHGHGYGILRSIEDDLRAGRHVVANVSRGIIDVARERFPRVAVIQVEASRDRLAARLVGRGREDETAIAARLERATRFVLDDTEASILNNDGTPEEGVAAMVALIQRLTR